MKNNNKLERIFNDYIVSFFTLMVLKFGMIMIDYPMSEVIYVDALDMGPYAITMALAMTFTIATLPTIIAKLLVRSMIKLALVGMLFQAGLLGFLYIGQHAVSEIMANDPTMLILGAEPVKEGLFPRHLIGVSLTALLSAITILVAYLYYSDVKRHKPLSFQFAMDNLARNFTYQLTILKGKMQRALDLPTKIAERRVNKKMENLSKFLKDAKRKKLRLEGERAYQLQRLSMIKRGADASIDSIYNSN
ncbi:MAG: hypothetical protein ABJG41_14855 [Cyclobacteriaceae bacterium]